LGSDRNSDGVKWQLLNNTAAYVEWKLIAFTGNVYSSNIGVHSSTSRPAWFQQKAFFFIGSGSPNTVQVVEYDGSSADYAWTKSPAATPVVGDTFKIVMRS